jgi:hypothetical protein
MLTQMLTDQHFVWLLIGLGCFYASLQFWLIRKALKQHNQRLQSVHAHYPRTRKAPGTHSYCSRCRYYANSSFLVCTPHPVGWPELEHQCHDFDSILPEEQPQDL